MKNELTTKQFANALGVSHDTVNRWVKAGKVKAIRRGVFIGKTSPFLILAAELERVKKLMEPKK